MVTLPGSAPEQTVGLVTGFNGTLPRWQTYTSMDYKRGNYGAFVGLRYLPSLTDLNDGSEHRLVPDVGCFGLLRLRFRAQGGSAGAKVTIGVNNLFNKFGPLDLGHLVLDSNVDTGTLRRHRPFLVYADLKYKFLKLGFRGRLQAFPLCFLKKRRPFTGPPLFVFCHSRIARFGLTPVRHQLGAVVGYLDDCGLFPGHCTHEGGFGSYRPAKRTWMELPRFLSRTVLGRLSPEERTALKFQLLVVFAINVIPDLRFFWAAGMAAHRGGQQRPADHARLGRTAVVCLAGGRAS